MVGKQAHRLTKERFDMLILSYQLEKNGGEFKGSWNPFHCSDPKQFAEAVTKPNRTGNGNDFQGDHSTLQLLADSLDLQIIVVRAWNPQSVVRVRENGTWTIFLLHVSNNHYQLLGFLRRRSGRIKTLFRTNHLPSTVNRYFYTQKLISMEKEREELNKKKQKQKQHLLVLEQHPAAAAAVASSGNLWNNQNHGMSTPMYYLWSD
jgi:hypothetical protein